MTRVLILGAAGMFGHQAFETFSERFETTGTIRRLDPAIAERGFRDPERLLTGVEAERPETVARAIAATEPDWVLNCIGIVKQRDDAKREIPSIEVNALFPHLLADLCESRQARLIHLSTDCVFAGDRGHYSENDTPDATDLYGKTKALGEVTREGALTIRTSMIGRELVGRASLVEWFLAQGNGPVRGFVNAFFSGLTTLALARAIADVIAEDRGLSGVYHVAGDRISKHDLLVLLRSAYDRDCEIVPDESFHCDRSLDDSRYRSATGFSPESWPAMVAEMADRDRQMISISGIGKMSRPPLAR